MRVLLRARSFPRMRGPTSKPRAEGFRVRVELAYEERQPTVMIRGDEPCN